MRVPIHMSVLLINLWDSPNPLSVRDNYVTPTGNWLHANYLQNRKHVQTLTQLAVNNRCVWFNGELVHIQDNYFDTTVYNQQ